MSKTPAAQDNDKETDSALGPLNKEAVRLLVENHRRFRNFLTKRVASEADAEEILQQSLSRAIERSPSATGEQSILAWFYQVLRNGLIDHYRSRASDRKKLDELAISTEIDAGAGALEVEVCECMKGLLPTLKDEYAEVIRRVDLEEQSPEEVAKSLGITRNSLDVRLHRARKALKTSLVRSCGTCTEHGCLNCTCQ